MKKNYKILLVCAAVVVGVLYFCSCSEGFTDKKILYSYESLLQKLEQSHSSLAECVRKMKETINREIRLINEYIPHLKGEDKKKAQKVLKLSQEALNFFN